MLSPADTVSSLTACKTGWVHYVITDGTDINLVSSNIIRNGLSKIWQVLYKRTDNENFKKNSLMHYKIMIYLIMTVIPSPFTKCKFFSSPAMMCHFPFSCFREKHSHYSFISEVTMLCIKNYVFFSVTGSAGIKK